MEFLSNIVFDYGVIIISALLVVVVLLVLYIRQGNGSIGGGSYLTRFAIDLTQKAENGELGPIIGRSEEIRKIVRILSRRQKNNSVLVGKAGVGKTAIGEGLAIAIAEGRVPRTLSDKRVLSLDLTALVAGTKYRGDFEKRLNRIMKEIQGLSRKVILFIDELHTLSVAGQAEGAISAGDILKPALARGDLQVIGSTTPIEYEKYIRTDPTLERRFQPILVPEPTKEQTVKILQGIQHRFAEYHGVKIPEETLQAAVDFAEEYLKDRSYPDKAIDLLDEASSAVSLAALSEGDTPMVEPKDVKEIASEDHIFI